MLHRLAVFALSLCLMAPCAFAATTYDVGPGYAKTQLRDVAWASLQPGDIVNIHTTPGGYHEMFLLSQSGTAAQHIVVRGIPDAQGNLPVIDGANAVMDPNIHVWTNSLKGLGVIVVSLHSGQLFGVSPSYIDIESLEVRNGKAPYTYTDDTGKVSSYSAFVASIYVEHSHHLSIRGCNVHDSGLGIFANSKYGGIGTSTQDILIEHNWIHHNGVAGSYSEHGVYVESVGAIYQYNVVGPQNAGAGATGIKDRSSGTVVRYNTFINAGANYLLMLVDPAYPLMYSRADYRESFVYGNTFYNNSTFTTSLIRYGGDQPTYSHYRQGTLHFYHNTVVSVQDQSGWPGVNVFDVPLKVVTGNAPMTEVIDARNNIFASLPVTPGGTGSKLTLLNTDVPGTLILGNNWVSPNTLLSKSSATITGAASLLYGDSVGANNPGFLNAPMQDLRLATGARSIDGAGTLAPAVTSNTLGQDLSVTEEIGPLAASHVRSVMGAGVDLGAFESDGSVAAPAAGALGFAYNISGQVYYESVGQLTFMVSRLGGNVGAVSVDYATTDGSATAGLDYTARSGTLTWADGDVSSKPIQVPVLPDGLVESQENFSIRLSNPGGGAILGAGTYFDISIRDGNGTAPSGGLLTFSASTYTVSEGAGNALITVNRTGGSAGAVTVHYATSNGTAQSGSDYASSSGTLSWAAGDTAPQSFAVGITDDSLTEINETISLTLSAVTGGASIGSPSAATLTIGDNDQGPPPPQELIFAVGASTDLLVAFYSTAPQTILSSVPITGLLAGEIVRAIDFEPLSGRLYVLGMLLGTPVTANHLYTVDPITGVATLVNSTSFSPLLVHPSCDLGFDPASGALRITVGTGQQNLQLNAAAGTVASVDTPLAFASGDAHSGATPSIVGSDYQKNSNGTRTLYGIDQTLDVLVRIGSVGGAPSAASSGLLTTIGPLGVDTSGVTGLDFSSTSGAGFACLGGPGATTGDLYYIDTTTGAANLVGQISLSEAVRDIAVAPPYLAWRYANFAGNVPNPDIAGDDATPANDGVANLMKYALGMSPYSSSTTGLPTPGYSAGQLMLGFTRAAPDVTYEVEVSPDLTQWTPGSSYGLGGNVPNTAATTDITPGGSPTGWTVVKDNATGLPRHFMKLRVSIP